MPREIGYAVVGLGMGRTHARAAADAENCRLVAVCDIDEERLNSVVDELGCEGYTDYSQMLQRDDIDIVSIATPSGLHANMAIQAAEAGKHALVEKPLDINIKKIDAMIQAFREKGRKLGGIFQNRLRPASQFIKKAMENGDLGRPISCDIQVKWWRTQDYYEQNGGWRGTWAMDGGGSLMNQSVHTIDLMQWFMGPVKSVFGKYGVYAHDIEAEDTGLAVVTFENGAIGTIMGTTCAYPGLGTHVTIVGDKGSCYYDGAIKRWRRRVPDSEKEEQEVLSKYGASGSGEGTADPGAISKSGHHLQVQDMVNAVLEDRDPLIPGPEGRHAVEIILAVYESARRGEEVFLPLE